jgi:hypothetical protein
MEFLGFEKLQYKLRQFVFLHILDRNSRVKSLKLANQSKTSIKIDLLLQRLPFLEVTNSSRMIPRMCHFENLIMVTLIGFTR